MSARRAMSPMKPGDQVVRRHRLLKTTGILVRFGRRDEYGAPRAWIKWSHPTTLPNPSLEAVDELELAADDGPGTR